METPQIRPLNLTELGIMILDGTKAVECSLSQTSKYSLLPRDILFNNTNSPELVGKVAVFRESGCFVFSNHITRIRVRRDTLLPEFLHRFLFKSWSVGFFQHHCTQWINQAAINVDALAKVKVPVPPLAEQERIVKLLDEADELRKLRAQADRRTADLIPAFFDELFGDPVKNLNAWPDSTFADHLELLEYGPRFYNEAYSETGPHIVRITDLDVAGNLNFSTMPRLQVDAATFKARGLEAGELIFARSGATVGKVAVVPDDAPPCIAGAYFIRLRLEPSIHPVYAAYLIRCPSVQGIIMNNSKQSAQQNFSGPGIRSLPLPVPPLPLQKEFAARVSDIRAMQAEQASSRRRLDDLFQSMLHRAFNSEL